MSRISHISGTKGVVRTRERILQAALRLFATRGYASASTQVIVRAARVTKPVLYYHFGSKVGLFRAIVDQTEEQLHAAILKIKAGTSGVHEQLVEISLAMFQFACQRPAVMGLAVELWMDAKERGPARKHCLGKVGERLAVIGEIMERGMADGTLCRQYGSRQLAVGFLSLLHFHILLHLAHPEIPLTRRSAVQAVSLFLGGAGGSSRVLPPARPRRCRRPHLPHPAD